MKKYYILLAVFIAVMIGFACCVMAADMTKDEIVAKAKKAIAERGIAVVDCNVLYDEKNKTWEEWGAYVAQTPNDKNHGYLPHGILANKKYQAVFFDFIDDAKEDIWVFVDLETGDVLSIYAKK